MAAAMVLVALVAAADAGGPGEQVRLFVDPRVADPRVTDRLEQLQDSRNEVESLRAGIDQKEDKDGSSKGKKK